MLPLAVGLQLLYGVLYEGAYSGSILSDGIGEDARELRGCL